MLDDLFQCRLQKHKMKVLVPRKHSLAIMSVVPFCKSRPGFDTCMTKIQTLCHRSSSVILKTIRVSMALLPSLLEKFPDLRVIHLLRDPRGILDSRRRGGFLRNTGFEQSARSLCDLLRINIEYSKILQRQFPDRITTVLYEDLAESPLELSHKLYRHLHLEYSDNFEEWVFNHTSAGTPNNSYYGTIRSNSSQTSQSWRKRLKFEDVKAIEKTCAGVIELIGFRNVTDKEDLQNTTRTLRIRDKKT